MARKRRKRHRKRRPKSGMGKINAQLRMKLERQHLEAMVRRDTSHHSRTPRERVQTAADEVDEALARLGALFDLSGGEK